MRLFGRTWEIKGGLLSAGAQCAKKGHKGPGGARKGYVPSGLVVDVFGTIKNKISGGADGSPACWGMWNAMDSTVSYPILIILSANQLFEAGSWFSLVLLQLDGAGFISYCSDGLLCGDRKGARGIFWVRVRSSCTGPSARHDGKHVDVFPLLDR